MNEWIKVANESSNKTTAKEEAYRTAQKMGYSISVVPTGGTQEHLVTITNKRVVLSFMDIFFLYFVSFRLLNAFCNVIHMCVEFN